MTRTLDDLRDTLDRTAGQMPIDAGLLPDVRGRAARLRRRRTALRGTAVAAVLAVAAAATPLMVRTASAPGGTAPAATPEVSRSATQSTLTLRDGSAFTVIQRDTDADQQYFLVRNIADVASERPGEAGLNGGADVAVYDPGAFDPAPLRRGTPIEVNGVEGWFVPEYKLDRIEVATVGWQDRGGAWVLVGGRKSEQDELLEVARDIVLTEATDLVSPVRLGWLPDGLTPVEGADSHGKRSSSFAAYGFGLAGEKGAVGLNRTLRDTELPLQFLISAKNPDWENYKVLVKGKTPRTYGKMQAWYLPRPDNGFTGVSPKGAEVIMLGDDCQAILHVRDRSEVTEADVDQILANATFTSCTNTEQWAPPVG